MTQLVTREDSDLSVRIAGDCDTVIAAEIERLRRRLPSLSKADVAAIDDALAQLAERLLLDAIRRRPELHDTVDPIFSPLNSQRKATS